MLKKIDNSIRKTIANSVETAKPYMKANVCVRLAYITFALIVIAIVVIVYILIIAPTLSNKSNGIVNNVNGVVFWVMQPVLTLISSVLLMVAITLTLIYIDPRVALTAMSGFGACYVVITMLSRQKLKQNGQRINDEQIQVIKALQEGLGGIRDVLLDGTQPVYCDIYRKADRPLRQASGSNIFIGGSPRFAM